MPAPRKARAPADSSDRQELEDLLRSAARFFEANKPPLTRQFSAKDSPKAAYVAAER
jgi:hypothetical protein